MKNTWILISWLFIQAGLLQAQVPPSSCEISGEDVFIRFHASCLLSDDPECMAIAEFKKYKLDSVIMSGSWKNWQKDGWTLSKTGPETYQMHKKLMLFDKSFDFEDKFKIDVSYWYFPVSERLKQGSSEFREEPVRVDFKGNVTFLLKGKNKANRVILSGSFNQWNEHELRMVKQGEDWKLTLQMPPGIYEYKFIVDGDWITDPANPFSVQNQHYTYNSILVVGKDEEFFLPGFQNAKRVALSGSFNNWDKTGVSMRKTKNGWQVKQKLPPGKHYYKFIVDKHDWITDPDQPLQEKDAEGNVNSVIIVH